MEREATRDAMALDGYWDAVLRGDLDSARSGDVGADVAKIVDGVQALGSSAPLFPDPERGWRELLQRPELHVLRGEEPAQPVRTTRDREETTMISGYTTPPHRGPPAISYLATAALLVLTLVGGFVAFGGSLRLLGSDQRSVIPAIDSAPESMRPSGAITDVTVLQATLETLGQIPSSRAAHWIVLNRYRLAPGAVQPIGKQEDTGVGLNLFTVEAGQLTVEADAPVFLTRAVANSAAVPSSVPSGTTIVLGMGDQLFAPSGVSFRRRNDGSTLAAVLDFALSSVGDTPRTTALPPGVSFDPNFNHPYEILTAFPTVPAEATVHRLTLAPGAQLAVRDLPGLELVYVEAGTLDLVFDKGGTLTTPERVRTLRAGAGTETFGRTPERAVLANRGTEPLVLLTASVRSTSGVQPAPQEP